MALWIPALVLAAVTAAGVWFAVWQLRANDCTAERRNEALLRGVQSLARPVALAVPAIANDAEIPAMPKRAPFASGDFPVAKTLLSDERRRALVTSLRDPLAPPQSPETYADLVGLTLQEAPWLPDRWPATVEGDVLLYRPGPYADPAILLEVAHVLCERAGVEVTNDDLALLARDLASPRRGVATK